MTIEEGTNQKNHRVLKMGIFGVSLAAIVLSAFFLSWTKVTFIKTQYILLMVVIEARRVSKKI